MRLAILEMWSLAGVQGSKAKGDEKNEAVLSDCPSQPLCVHWASGWTMPEHIKALAKHCLPALTFGLLLCGELYAGVCVCVCVRAGRDRQWAEAKQKPAVSPTPWSTITFNEFPLSVSDSSPSRLLGFIVCEEHGMTPAPTYTYNSQG